MKRAFTLIELLIVIAIIAILALIAIPNFLEAQVRAKVARVKSDMRAVATAVEAYYVDYNTYPLASQYINWSQGCYRVYNTRVDELVGLRRPVQYLSNIRFYDPFQDREVSWDTSYHFVNCLGAVSHLRKYNSTSNPFWGEVGGADLITKFDVAVFAPTPMRFGGDKNSTVYPAYWALASAGPDLSEADPRAGGGAALANVAAWLKNWNNWAMYTVNASSDLYDPTNGTKSRGNIWRVSPGAAANK